MRISVDGGRICNNKVAFLNLSGIVWTGPQSLTNISCCEWDFSKCCRITKVTYRSNILDTSNDQNPTS